MLTPTELALEVHDMEGQIKAFETRRRHAITNRDNPEFLARSIDAMQKSIEKQQAQLAELLYARDHADEVIASSTDTIKDLKKRLKMLRNQREISKLLELQKEINAAQEDLDNG